MITLDHTLYSKQSNSKLTPSTLSSAWTTPTRRPTPQTHFIPLNSNDESNETFDFECGGIDYKAPAASGLVLGGQKAHRGQFPW